jgi:hypothetical protein
LLWWQIRCVHGWRAYDHRRGSFFCSPAACATVAIPIHPETSRAGLDIVNAQPRLRKDIGVSRPRRVKPANLIYSVDEVPPLPLTIVMGLQHVFVMSVGWIFVVVVATSIGSRVEAETMIRMSMIASGLATILQAQTRGPIGSGYLCPFSCGPAYVSASILAGQVGGLPLLWGMTTWCSTCYFK